MGQMKADVVVIGGGIVGLSTAYQLSLEKPAWRIVVVEKEHHVATHQTGHNSGVVHAGVYYAPGSLKARYSKAGVKATTAFCRAQNLPYEQCGKLLVATTPTELVRMSALQERCIENGLNVTRISGEDIAAYEPNICGLGALLVEETGICDYALIAKRFAELVVARNGVVLTGQTVRAIDEGQSEVVVETDDTKLNGRFLVACAGLQSDRIARLAGLKHDYRIIPFRGEFYEVVGKPQNHVERLIYPIPDPSMPFVGIHLTRQINGKLKVGPNALLNLGRETYERFKPNMADLGDAILYPGLWRLISRHAKYAASEIANSVSKRKYLALCQRYCPDLEMENLRSGPAGIRAQAVTSDGTMVSDFLIRETARMVHVCNAPSPAATCAIPIGQHVRKMICERA